MSGIGLTVLIILRVDLSMIFFNSFISKTAHLLRMIMSLISLPAGISTIEEDLAFLYKILIQDLYAKLPIIHSFEFQTQKRTDVYLRRK